ncbi:MAG: transposase [Kofleriaceae bacterium]
MVHHVLARFVEREWRFESVGARERYFRLFTRAMEVSDWRCLAYCLMSNHLHLAMVAGETSLQSWTKRVHSPFANWLNAQHGRRGQVFEDRVASYVVPKHDEGRVLAYIHNNPVRAGVVADAGESSWSSHRYYVARAQPPRWLHVSEGLARAGCDQQPDRFDQFVRGARDDQMGYPDLAAVRRIVRKLGAMEIGTPVLETTPRIPIVARPFASVRPDPRRVLELVAAHHEIELERLRHPNPPRSTAKNLARIRLIAVHVAVRLGTSMSDIATALGVSRQRGSQLAQTALDSAEHEVVIALRDRLHIESLKRSG